MAGSYCPVCIAESGVDAEEWSQQHDYEPVPATCQNCGAKLRAYYDEYEEEGGFWAFEHVKAT